MVNDSKQGISRQNPGIGQNGSTWVRVGVIAAASAFAGGLAAAWWYRKTLKKLQDAGDGPQPTNIGISQHDDAE